MTRDEVISLARDAGFDLHYAGGEGNPPSAAVFGRCTDEMLRSFAVMAAVKEREACARLCEAVEEKFCTPDTEVTTLEDAAKIGARKGAYGAAMGLKQAIRARGQEAA